MDPAKLTKMRRNRGFGMVLLLVITTLAFVPSANSSAPSGPTIVGWGGTEVRESASFETTNPPSVVFSGEQASNQEMQISRLAGSRFNAFRVSFESQCTNLKEAGPYSSENLERSFRIAEHYNFWMIVDYHGYNDTVTDATVNCWLTFWNGVITQFKTRYTRTIWEPINEPTGLGFSKSAVPVLSNIYQRWVDQTRSLGDTNWIVVQNLCSFRCDFDDKEAGYPTVTDPLGRVLISLHPYMSYRYYWNTWDNQTAESRAQSLYAAILKGAQNTGWSVLNTEGGPGGTFNGTQRCPDLATTGSAGYCRTNFHFMQTITNLFDGNFGRRLNWIWWTMSSGTDTDEGGIYGALNTWGGILRYRPVLPGDFNNDCAVNIDDIDRLRGQFGKTTRGPGFDPSVDLNNDGAVNVDDLSAVGSKFGQTCS